MTNQIKKLYENVGLDNLWVERYNDSNGFEHENWYPSYNIMIKSMMEKNNWTLTEARNVAKKECHKELLPFTAEKQIELIKLLSKHIVYIDYDNGKYEVSITSIGNLRYDYYDTLEETLAYCINNLWQDLSEEEHKQIKEILK